MERCPQQTEVTCGLRQWQLECREVAPVNTLFLLLGKETLKLGVRLCFQPLGVLNKRSAATREFETNNTAEQLSKTLLKVHTDRQHMRRWLRPYFIMQNMWVKELLSSTHFNYSSPNNVLFTTTVGRSCLPP